MEVHALHASSRKGRKPDAVPEVTVVEHPATRTGEDQTRGTGVAELFEMIAEHGNDRLGQMDRPTAGIGLRLSEHQAHASDLGQLALYSDRASAKIHIATLQCDGLTPSQTAESCEQHQCSITVANGIRQAVDVTD